MRVVRTFHPGGGAKSEERFVAGRPEGAVRAWYPSGAVAEEGSFQGGVRHGTWRRYAEDGTVVEEMEWLSGEPVIAGARRPRTGSMGRRPVFRHEVTEDKRNKYAPKEE